MGLAARSTNSSADSTGQYDNFLCKDIFHNLPSLRSRANLASHLVRLFKDLAIATKESETSIFSLELSQEKRGPSSVTC